ncbi:uncharacterized protein NECHADRAFT_64607 [Fusarium vanettenii 77-13-4]|uniref:DOMON domain-containing protein n=1 Tax=Fusarium vanettenii (strain ATCC MYA-4622 / CBS 123669 / FGSC 9596 / NRRL 45880 / 77-13-4) TaxID=660122 RepID=C7ZIX0_FUSV7|nr:uncharacterized protein NECHADRAFT_64607 [Fusarium vanettenii 77-13-4]EEU36100.1 hypothetical protein NECHADRAFT_64607 [Fusarium vanettenii 77-13-4]
MKSLISTAVISAMSLLTQKASATLATYCTGDSNDVCYSWGVPESTASSGSGNIFFRLEAPADYQWVALGTGTGMSGSTMFVMYQDGSGNITLSTRKGHGHDMPEYNTFQGVKLLEGTGVSNKTMVANVQCNGFTRMDFSGSNDWIGAWKKGQALDSASVRAIIEEHDGTDGFSVDFSKASIASDENPFTKTSSKTPTSTSGNDAVSGGGGGEDHSGTIHGIIMSIVFLIGFPIGSLLMPLIGKWLVHAGWQIMVFVGMWVGFGVGKIAADKNGQWLNEPHVQLGLAVCILMILQPVLGWLHHRNYVKFQKRTPVSHGHLWYGRVLMIIGIINGGIGLQLASASAGLIAAYSVVGIIVFSLYVAGAVRKEMARRKKSKGMEQLDANSNSALELLP